MNRNRKTGIPKKHFINKILVVPLHFLKVKVQENLESGMLQIQNIDLKSLQLTHELRVKDYINKGYSIVFKYRGKNHILIYN